MTDIKSAIRPEYVRRAIMGHAAHAGISMAEVAERLGIVRTHLYHYLANPDHWPRISQVCGEHEEWLAATAIAIQVKHGPREHAVEAMAMLDEKWTQ